MENKKILLHSSIELNNKNLEHVLSKKNIFDLLHKEDHYGKEFILSSIQVWPFDNYFYDDYEDFKEPSPPILSFFRENIILDEILSNEFAVISLRFEITLEDIYVDNGDNEIYSFISWEDTDIIYEGIIEYVQKSKTPISYLNLCNKFPILEKHLDRLLHYGVIADPNKINPISLGIYVDGTPEMKLIKKL